MANTLTAASAAAGTTGQTGGSAPATGTANSQVTKDMFLKLMVAQLKNQNPLSPLDGVDFLTQLSQISGVEQAVEMTQHLAAIRKVLTANASGAGSDSGTGSGSTGTQKP